MSEPAGPTRPESDGWPPKPPMNPYPVENPQQRPTSRAEHPQPAYQQVYVEKAPSVLEGEKLAKTSTILGIVSIYCVGLILGPMAIVKAAKAEKLGVDSTVGKVTGWLGVIFGSITILISVLYFFIFAALFAAADMNSSDKIGTGGFSNSQNQNIEPRSNFDKTYEKLTPEEKAQMDAMLEQLDAEVSSR